ncbi:MAG TPA: glycoside hydrolase family 65 protein, partial [Firmicutes bacterium]|nr:glycoside hydrolase family 65 protein [Bacillota bacterium]
VAYGVSHYYRVAGDEKFMRKFGLEIMIDTAKFWASRMKKKGNRYVINGVIGPDELHENVNNSVFTNYCAKWNIQEALDLYLYFKNQASPDAESTLKKTSTRETDLFRWKKQAEKLKLPVLKGSVIEQFDGYFRKEYVPLRNFNRHGIPRIPAYLDDVEKIAKTQLIKQSDIVMLMVLFPEEFDLRTKKKNYHYYLKRNTHKSSLSPSMEGIMAAELGDMERFYKYFKAAAFMDMYDVNGNAADGVHGASLGGVWQMVFFGLLGFRKSGSIVSIRPVLLRQWSGYSLCAAAGEGTFVFDINRKKSSVKYVPRDKAGPVVLKIYEDEKKLLGKKTVYFALKKTKDVKK